MPQPHPPAAIAEPRRPAWREVMLAAAPLLALLPLLAYCLVLFAESQGGAAKRREAQFDRISATLAVTLENEVTRKLRVLEGLAASTALARRDLPALREEARRLLEREPAWQTIALFDGPRQVLNLRHHSDVAQAEIDLPVMPVGSGRASARDLPDGRIILRVPVTGDLADRSALVAVMEGGSLGAALAQIAIPPSWAAGLFNSQGRLLAGSVALRADATILRTVIAQPGRSHSLGEEEALARPLPDTGWAVLVAAPHPSLSASAPVWLALALLASAVAGVGGVLLALRAARRRRDAARERDEAEAAARNAEAERRRAELLSAAGDELRTPLAGLLGYTGMLLRSDLPAEARGLVEQQKRAGEMLQALIGDVLDPAQVEDSAVQLEDADLDLRLLLDEAADLVRGLAGQKGLALSVAADRGLPRWIRGDPLRLRQVVTNLLANAIDTTTEGEVTLVARLLPAPPMLEISVADTGPGEPGATERHWAGPDAAAGAFGGSGLGLATCQRLVTAMEGTITAVSRPGEGSRFVLRIPFRPGAAPTASRRDGALRLLIAEDVAASRLLLKALLDRAGHEVTAVEDGARALAALHGASFDLALLDLQMPEMDGMGVASAIRRMPGEAGRLPLIALTADPPDQIEAICRDAGFDAVLRKPFETRRLLGLIDALRGRRAEAAPNLAEAG